MASVAHAFRAVARRNANYSSSQGVVRTRALHGCHVTEGVRGGGDMSVTSAGTGYPQGGERFIRTRYISLNLRHQIVDVFVYDE